MDNSKSLTERKNEDQNVYINQSLDKSLSILDLFDYNNEKFSVTEIASQFEVNPSSLYPVLHTLEKHGYLKRDGNKKYQLGIVFAQKGRLVLDQLDLSRVARPELEKLRDETQKTVHLGSFIDKKVVYIDKVEAKSALKMYSSPGKTAPLHATALGKIILANLSTKDLNSVLEVIKFTPKTKNTIHSRDEILEEIQEPCMI